MGEPNQDTKDNDEESADRENETAQDTPPNADEAGDEPSGADDGQINETGSDETGSDETGSDETDSDETDSDETDSDETGSDETDSDETGSDAAEPDSIRRDSAGEPVEVHQIDGIAAFFDHPKHLLAAATYARDSDYEDFDAFSPFPIHGMDEAMGLGRSWIPWVTFAAGVVGFICANLLEFGTMTFDWPLIIGGKPFAPWPSFVPIMFELTVLIGGVTTAVVMLKAAGCFQKPLIIDPSITNDRFVLWISARDEQFDTDEATEFLEGLNPLEVRTIVKDV